MAKDGTVRGGPRTGSGRKSKALTDKIADGNPGKIKDFDRFIGLWVMLSQSIHNDEPMHLAKALSKSAKIAMPSMQDLPGLTEALRQYSSISSSVGELINRPSMLTESMEILQNAMDLPYTAIADTLLSALEPAGGIVKYFQEESAAEVSSLSKALENLIPSMPKMPDIMAAMNEFSAHIASVTHVNFDFSGICETAENLGQILEKHNISVLSSIITPDGDSLEYLETMQEQLSEIPEGLFGYLRGQPMIERL